MINELSSIERAYGSVAEYYRCLEERENYKTIYGYEPSYDELVEDGEYEDI